MNDAEYLMKNYGDRGGCFPSKAKFNNCFIYIHSKIIPSLRTQLKHAYLHRRQVYLR